MKETILASSVLILAVLVFRWLFRNTVSRRLQYALWGLVLLRLLLPTWLPSSSFSVLNALNRTESRGETAKVWVSSGAFTEGGDYIQDAERRPAVEEQTVPTDPGVPENGVPTEPTQETVFSSENAERLLPVLWGIGAAVIGLYFIAVNLRFYLRLRREREPFSTEVTKYPVYVVPSLVSPCLFGLLRPCIYLTPGSTEPRHLSYVLRHEEIHAKHLDHLWAFLRCTVLTVYWFHPLVWIAAVISRRDGELACDEGVMKRLSDRDRRSYGETILALVPVKGSKSPVLAATTMTAGKRELRDRLTRIAQGRKPLLLAAAAVLVLAAAAAIATFTAPREQAISSAERYFLEHTEEEIAAEFGTVPLVGNFSHPSELSADLLYMYLNLTGNDEESWYDEEKRLYTIPLKDITEALDQYFEGYVFIPEELAYADYHPEIEAFTATSLGFGSGSPWYIFESGEVLDESHICVTLWDKNNGYWAEVKAHVTGDGLRFESCQLTPFFVRSGDIDDLSYEGRISDLLEPPEKALGENGFTFDSPEEFTSEELLQLFFVWTRYDALQTYFHEADRRFYIPEDVIQNALDYFLKSYTFHIEECGQYDQEADAIVMEQLPDLDSYGRKYMRMRSCEQDGAYRILTVDFYSNYEDYVSGSGNYYLTKEYKLQKHEKGCYYLYAKVIDGYAWYGT